MIRWYLEGKSRCLQEVPSGARTYEVNGREVVGTCESCGRPILDGQQYESDGEGVNWHKRCPKRRAGGGGIVNATGIFGQKWELAKGGRSVNVGTPALGCKIRCEPTREDVTREVLSAVVMLPRLLGLAEKIAEHPNQKWISGDLKCEARDIIEAIKS